LSRARWFHILSGVMCVGLLFCVKVAQIPALAAADDKGGPGGAGIIKYVAPRALLWFRWAAVATCLPGAWYLVRSNKRERCVGNAGRRTLVRDITVFW
jgi:hypothetical protein